MKDIPSNASFYNLEAEKSLLGSVLSNNTIFEEVVLTLRAEHFFSELHQNIFSIMLHLFDKSHNIDTITISNYSSFSGKYADVTFDYLVDLSDSVISLATFKDYISIIYDLYLKRQIIAIQNNITNYLYSENTALEQLAQIEKDIYNLAEQGFLEKSSHTFETSLKKAIELAEYAKTHRGSISGVTTGLYDLNRKLGGLQKSDLVVLAARPSMGKTALATNIAFKAAKEYVDKNQKAGASTIIFSLEMSSEQISTRILTTFTGISGDSLRRGAIEDGDFARLASAAQQLKNIPLFIDDTPNLSISQIRARVRRLKRQHNIGLVVVDYIQLIGNDSGKRNDNRATEVGEITRGLKGIAKEFNLPVLALSQLSRAVESRDDNIPLLSDLRESGSIEQDADVVAFIYREEYYLRRKEPNKTSSDDKDQAAHRKWKKRLQDAEKKATIIIAKNRHGAIGNIDVYFDADRTQFYDLERVN